MAKKTIKQQYEGWQNSANASSKKVMAVGPW